MFQKRSVKLCLETIKLLPIYVVKLAHVVLGWLEINDFRLELEI